MESEGKNTRTTGDILATARRKKGVSLVHLAHLTGISKSALHRMENNQIDEVPDGRLERIAAALNIPLMDLYDHQPRKPDRLPSFVPYLRSKYGELPPQAQDELERAFAQVAAKYGYDPKGPARGEDE